MDDKRRDLSDSELEAATGGLTPVFDPWRTLGTTELRNLQVLRPSVTLGPDLSLTAARLCGGGGSCAALVQLRRTGIWS